jgi:hypothetical protein
MDSLSITAVIATILSMIFAAGALWNSIARRRHEARIAKAMQPPEEMIKFKPMPSTAPAASPAITRQPRQSTPPQLFRQIRPTGEIEDEVFQEDEDMYVWE